MADYYLSALVAVLSTAVPGVLLMLPFAKRAGMQLPFAIGFGFAAGMVLVPLLGFAESLVGIPFSSTAAFLNVAALSFVGAFLCIREKAFSGTRPAGDAKSFLLANWHWLALLAVILLAFWLRSLSSQPYPYETDPYFYLRATQFIVQDGSIPAHDELAWYPNSYTHRERPLTHYLTAGWYLLANPGGQFGKEALYTAAAPYPPLAAALSIFMIFAIACFFWGERWGLLAAAIFAFTHVAVIKTAAGIVEQQPWGIFALLFFCAAYCLCLKKGGYLYAALAGLAMLGAVLGSKQDVFPVFVFAAFISLQSLREFLSGGMRQQFLLESAIVAACGVLGFLIMLPYHVSGTISTAAIAAAIGFPALLFAIEKYGPSKGARTKYLAVLAAVAILAIVLTPLGPLLVRYAGNVISGSSASLFSAAPVEEQVVQADMGLHLGPIGGYGLLVPMLLASMLVLAAAAMRKGAEAQLMLLVLLQLAWLGFMQGKFFMHAAAVLPIAFAALFGEIERYARPPAKEEKPALAFSIDPETGQAAVKSEEAPDYARYAPAAVLALGILLVLAQALPVADSASAAFQGKYFTDAGEWDCPKLLEDGKQTAAMLCAKLPPEWAPALDWLGQRDANSTVLAWWDYGHWINYLAQQPVVIRGDLAYPEMISEAAVICTTGTPQQLASYMREKHARYVLFDSALLPKWESLSYLSCQERNMTTAPFRTGNYSACEQELSFEYLFVPLEGLSQADVCDLNGTAALRVRSSFNRTYCLVEPGIGQEAAGVLPVFFENGTRVEMGQVYMAQVMANGRPSAVLLAAYNESSWSYRQGRAYDSPFYSGLLLRKIPGFRQVYPDVGQPSGIVIFELENPT